MEHAEASRKQSTSYHEGTAGSDASAALASLPKNRLVFTPAMLATGVSAMRFRGPYSPPSFPGSRPDSRIAEERDSVFGVRGPGRHRSLALG